MKKPNTDELLIDLVSRKMRGDNYSVHDLIAKVKWDYPDVYEAFTTAAKNVGFKLSDKGRKEIIIKIIKDNSTITDLPHDL